jgi:hypothetical protein
MAVAYACIVPIDAPVESSRAGEALSRVSQELAGYRPGQTVLVAPGASGATKIGVQGDDTELVSRLVAKAKERTVPTETLRRWSGDEPLIALATPSLCIATCALEPRLHFEFGRAASSVLDPDDPPSAIVCAVQLSKDQAHFDTHYRRALEPWDVKSIVNMDSSLRSAARERAIAQTALLMGALGGYRIQPRELAYEPSASGGYIVAAVDVLGRRKER